MFTHIRWRLIRWNVAVFGLILVVVGGLAYIAAAKWLPLETDRDLENRSATLVTNPQAAEMGTFFAGETGYRSGYLFLALDANGQVLANPQQVTLPELPAIAPGDYTPRFVTVRVNEEPTRLYIRPIRPLPIRADVAGPDPLPAAFVVGQSLVPMQRALRRLLIGLVGGGVAGGLLLFGGAWFMSGRALVPIETAFQRQHEFIADASHELRTPLTVLRASADLLDRHRTELLEANGELLDDLRDGLSRLERLADDLLTLARADLGAQQLDLDLAPLNLAEFAGGIIRRLTPLARAHGLTLIGEASGDEVSVEADPDRLDQVLLILLDNAFAHTPTGGTVRVAVARQGDEALLTVRDTGAGIPPERLARIFDRFYRARRCPFACAGRGGARAGDQQGTRRRARWPDRPHQYPRPGNCRHDPPLPGWATSLAHR